MVDTNVLFSALVKYGSGAGKLIRLIQREYHLLIPDYVLIECEKTAAELVPDSLPKLKSWIRAGQFQCIPVRNIMVSMPPILDPKDKPILQAALSSKPDFFVTNDLKHFHTPAIQRVLRVVTVSEMLRLLKN